MYSIAVTYGSCRCLRIHVTIHQVGQLLVPLVLLLSGSVSLNRLGQCNALKIQENYSFHDDGDDSNASTSLPDYLIVGAGGGGIQTAIFLETYDLSYRILEKESVVGSFWTKFPKFKELISVNKWVRNETQWLKYDWHSFLGTPLRMLDETESYFPNGEDWHRYMSRVAEESGIKDHIEFGAEVKKIADDGTPCVYLVDGSKRCATRRIFVGTGMQQKEEPYLEAIGGIPYSRVTREMARRRGVCILGNGNSGFEVAQNVFDVAERVTIYGRTAPRLSAVTRYTGDVRVKYLQTHENLNGKLLDTVDHFETPLPRIAGALVDILTPDQLLEVKELVRTAAWLNQFNCETFFFATGFKSHVPGVDLGGSKFPETNDWYRSKHNPAVHYVGWLMHERDFRRGAGGFLSGYRYLIRNLVRHVRSEDFGVTYPHHVFTSKAQVVRHAIARFQVADDLMILQDGVVLRDLIVPVKGQDGAYHYYEGATYQFHDDLLRGRDDVISLYFAWGNGRTATHVFDTVYRYSDTGTLINMFLHPVVEVCGLVRDIHEDLDMTWVDPAYVSAMDKALRQALDGDLSLFLPRASNPYSRAVINQTEAPNYYEAAPLESKIDPRVMQSLWKAIYTNGRSNEMQNLRVEMKKWMPALFDHEVQIPVADMIDGATIQG